MAVSFIVGGIGVPRENHRPVASHCQTLSRNVVLSTSRPERDSNSQLVICTDYTVVVCFLVRWCFNTTINNISAKLKWSFLSVEETRGSMEKPTDLSQVTDKLNHIIWSRFELTTSMVIGTDRIGSCKSNYYTITATTASHK